MKQQYSYLQIKTFVQEVIKNYIDLVVDPGVGVPSKQQTII